MGPIPGTTTIPPGEWRETQLPADVAKVIGDRPTKLFFATGSNCKVLLSQCGRLGWHLSISHPWRDPTWDEIKSARYALVPDAVRMTMDLPPSSEFVNVHEHCFRLYECRCNTNP